MNTKLPPQSTPPDFLKSEAQGMLIFAIPYAVGVAIHYQFDSPKIREVRRQVLYAAGLAVICYLLAFLFRLRSARRFPSMANQPSPPPERSP